MCVGRTRASVILPDGLNLNQELVKQGWCWWYRKYAQGDTVLEGLEQEAREGLWADPVPVAVPSPPLRDALRTSLWGMTSGERSRLFGSRVLGACRTSHQFYLQPSTAEPM